MTRRLPCSPKRFVSARTCGRHSNIAANCCSHETQAEAALRDFSEAIRLAPGEAHLYALRGHAYSLLGDEPASRSDYARAAELQAGLPGQIHQGIAAEESPRD